MLLVTQFLAQVSDIDLDVVRVAEKVVTPDLVQDAVAGKDLVGMEHEQAEQIELARRELHRPTLATDLAGGDTTGSLRRTDSARFSQLVRHDFLKVSGRSAE